LGAVEIGKICLKSNFVGFWGRDFVVDAGGRFLGIRGIVGRLRRLASRFGDGFGGK
jgi:hypothetical protein